MVYSGHIAIVRDGCFYRGEHTMSDKSNERESARELEVHTDQEKWAGCIKLEEPDVEGIAGGASRDEPIELPEI